MTEPLSFAVHLPPRGWQRARTNGRRFFKDPNTQAFQDALALSAKVAMRGREPFAGPVELLVVSVLPVPPSWSTRRRLAALKGEIRPTDKPDADNLIKQMDALNRIVWRDDAQVVDGRSVKVYGADPAMLITVREAQAFMREAA
jgi:Holliday junction resolvase RusA-like endonuclease